MDKQTERRAAVVVEALTWLGTPYRHMGRIKGVGTDCAMLPAEVYAAVGVIPPQAIAYYPLDWHLHQGAPLYLDRVLMHAREITVDQIQPGDLVLWKYGRAWAHGAIVISWPDCIHAAINGSVQMVNALADADLCTRHPRYFSMWDVSWPD